MRKLFVCFIFILTLFVNYVEAGWLKEQLGLEYDFSERAVIEFSPEERSYWKQANAYASPEGNSTVEWIPRHETLNNRTQLLTFQFFANHQDESAGSVVKELLFSPKPFARRNQNHHESAGSYINMLYAQMRANYPDMIWNTISLSENDVVYEWVLPMGIPSKNIPPQHEISRILTTQKGMHRIAYERKTARLNGNERALWINRISNAPIRTK